MDKIKVYIASPYTVGDAGSNVKKQMDLAHLLMDLGYAPYAPLMSHFMHISRPRVYDDWLNFVLEWLKPCNAVIRLKGESKGADIEEKFARERDIPVFYTLSDLVEWTLARWPLPNSTDLCRKKIIDQFNEINNRISI